MGSSKTKAPTYVGVSKEQLAQQQQAYDQRISLMSQQNAALQDQLGNLTRKYEQDYGQRTSLLSNQLNEQKSAYDALLSNAQRSLEMSSESNVRSKSAYDELNRLQDGQTALVSAERERASLLQQDQATRLGTRASQQTSGKRRSRTSLINPV